jgi:hypothetical protein
MTLQTIADLSQPTERLTPCLSWAQQLSRLYFAHVQENQDNTYEYNIRIFGSSGRSQGVHASELSKCPRSLVYGIQGVERRSDPTGVDVNMLTRFKLGHAIHAMVQEDWKQIATTSNGAITFEAEVPIKPDSSDIAKQWNIHSSCDGVITGWGAPADKDKYPAVRIGLEIKSISDDGFKKLQKPQADHIEQTHVYMRALDLPLMWLLYYNKNNSNITPSITPFLFTFDSKLWDKLEMRIAKYTFMAEKNQIPERKTGMYCRWCPFTWICNPPTNRKNSRSKI